MDSPQLEYNVKNVYMSVYIYIYIYIYRLIEK